MQWRLPASNSTQLATGQLEELLPLNLLPGRLLLPLDVRADMLYARPVPEHETTSVAPLGAVRLYQHTFDILDFACYDAAATVGLGQDKWPPLAAEASHGPVTVQCRWQPPRPTGTAVLNIEDGDDVDAENHPSADAAAKIAKLEALPDPRITVGDI